MHASANTARYPISGTSAIKAHEASSFEIYEGGSLYGRVAAQSLSPVKLFMAGAALIFAIVAVLGASMVCDLSSAQRRLEIVDSLSYQEVVVLSGQGLWDIAQTNPVDGLTTAELVEHIIEVNALPNATLQPGQRLSVPAAN